MAIGPYGQAMPIMGAPMLVVSGGVPMLVPGGGGMLMMGQQGPIPTACTCKVCHGTMARVGRTMGGDIAYECQICNRTIVLDPQTGSAHEISASSRGSQGHGASRQERLRDGPTQTLYHQTDKTAAAKIIASQQMRRGDSNCSVGSGIYFAMSKEDTHRKARNHGVILAADVTLGRTKHLSNSARSSFAQLNNEGYDSIRLTCYNGDEIIVYNWDQVNNIRES